MRDILGQVVKPGDFVYHTFSKYKCKMNYGNYALYLGNDKFFEANIAEYYEYFDFKYFKNLEDEYTQFIYSYYKSDKTMLKLTLLDEKEKYIYDILMKYYNKRLNDITLFQEKRNNLLTGYLLADKYSPMMFLYLGDDKDIQVYYKNTDSLKKINLDSKCDNIVFQFNFYNDRYLLSKPFNLLEHYEDMFISSLNQDELKDMYYIGTVDMSNYYDSENHVYKMDIWNYNSYGVFNSAFSDLNNIIYINV